MDEKLQFLRQRIEHENNLINQRLSSLVGSQAFLVSAFAISLNAPAQFHQAQYEALHRQLIWMLPITGIATVIVVTISLLGALVALHKLHRFSDTLAATEELPIHSSRFVRWMGNAAVVGVPLIFLILWSLLLHPFTQIHP